MNDSKIQILIIDLGSQYTQIIRRSLRYLGFHSIILPPAESLDWIAEHKIKGIILSGGSASVYKKNAPAIPEKILNLNIPILGICFGMQWLAYINDPQTVHHVRAGKSYGPVEITLGKSKLFENLQEKTGKLRLISAWNGKVEVKIVRNTAQE